MDFQEFWHKLQDELTRSKDFKTLTYDRRFKAYFESNKKGELMLKIMTDEGKIRGISRYEFNGVWDNVKRYSKETRLVNKNRRLEPYPKRKGGIGKSMQVSYIVKLIKHIVNDQNMK